MIKTINTPNSTLEAIEAALPNPPPYTIGDRPTGLIKDCINGFIGAYQQFYLHRLE